MNKIRIFFFLFLFVLLSNTVSFAQKSNKDSLLQLIRIDKADTNKVIHSYKLCWEYIRKGMFDSAMHYGNSALELGQQLNFKKGIVGAYGNMGNAYYEQGDYPTALDYYFKTLKVAEELGDKKIIVRWLGNIGVVLSRQGNYPQALDYYFKALRISESLNDKKGIASACNNIGIIYKYKNNYVKALNYFSTALKISEQLDDKMGIANNLGNIGIIYDNQKQYNRALEHFFKSLAFAEELGAKRIIASNYDNIGSVYTTQKKYDAALEYYFKALKIDEELGNKNGIAIKLGNIGSLYTSTKKYPLAEDYLKRSLAIAEEIGNLEDVKVANDYLSELYLLLGKYQKSMEHYKRAVVAKDSIFNEQKNTEIIQKEMAYELAKKEMATKASNDRLILEQETEKKKQQVILWSVLAGLLLVLVFTGFVFRSLKITEKQKKLIEIQKEKVEHQNEEIIKQKELVEDKNKEITNQRDTLSENLKYTQKLQQTLEIDLSKYQLISLRKLMNPHFIFNSLNSIQSFILQNDKLKASLFLSKFSSLVRKILEHSQNEYISLAEEIETLNIYLELEAERFVGKFTHEISIDAAIVADHYLVGPLLFQPFVENAIWHGLMPKEESGKIHVSVTLLNGSIFCSVEDNGIGRDAAMQIQKAKKKTNESFGIKATNQRLKIINSLKNKDAQVNYIDLKDHTGKACGTRVEFFLPLIENKTTKKQHA